MGRGGGLGISGLGILRLERHYFLNISRPSGIILLELVDLGLPSPRCTPPHRQKFSRFHAGFITLRKIIC